MEDFFQFISCITFTFIIGFYIKRLKTITNNFKKKDYHEIDDNETNTDETNTDETNNLSENSIIDLFVEDNTRHLSPVSDISTSNSDDEFIIINEV